MSESAKALFLSYASEDSQVALRVCAALRAAGVEVWFDQSELRGGDAWDQKIRRQIRSCALFMPLISAKTRDRTEGYFRLEWKLAVDRSHLMAADRAFLVPVAIGGNVAADATVPDRFRELQWIQLTAGVPTAEFIEHIKQLLDVASVTASEPQVRDLQSAALSVPPTARHSDARGGRGRVLAGGTAVALLVLVGAGWLYRRTLTTTPRVTSSTQSVTQNAPGSGNTGLASVPVAALPGTSLAVLPFVDLSPEHNQDYFSDGLSEELLNQLAQIKDLHVTGRTSSFSFKGKNEDLRVIGEKLGVGNILEGSVRKDGNHLRITAQLVNSRDGTELWSQSYDRELRDVFAVQEEIAMSVSAALSVTLDVGEMSRARGGTTQLDAYDKFLQATKLSQAEGYANLHQSAQLFREAVALDPSFSRAWGGLYQVLDLSLVYFPDENTALRRELDAIAVQAGRLPQDTSAVQLIRARSLEKQHAWGAAQQAYDAALRLAAPSDPLVLLAYSEFLGATGGMHEAIVYGERARTVDPLNLAASTMLQIAYGLGGRTDLADAEYERSKPLQGDHQVNDYHELIRMLEGGADPRRIDAQFAQYHSKDFNAMPLTRYLMGHWRDRKSSLTEIRKAYEDPTNHTLVRLEVIAEFADYCGDTGLALAALREQYVEHGDTTILFIWKPYVTRLRTDARFRQMLRDLAIAQYYFSSGNWGDFCNPVGKDDFQCH
jgi:TolB-like protein